MDLKCWSCKKELNEVNRTWKYGIFDVKEFLCSCGAVTREYSREGKAVFYLGNIKGKTRMKKVIPP